MTGKEQGRAEAGDTPSVDKESVKDLEPAGDEVQGGCCNRSESTPS